MKQFLRSVSLFLVFLSPFFAVLALENARREGGLAEEQSVAAEAKREAEDARYRYYLGVAEQRDSLKKSMEDAKSQYDRLIGDQPQMVRDNRQTVTQTTTEPVVTKQVISQPVTSSKPKSSSKTKTS